MSTPELFPVFVKLHGRRVLVVGGGQVATSKIAALLQSGAAVTVVAPDITEAIARAPVRVIRRGFRPSDLAGRWLVVSAATPPVNRAVAHAAAKRRIFVNAVDDPANASAYLGAVIRRAGVTLAVSTNGHAPALAGLLREGLEALLPADLDRWVTRARRERRRWRRTGVPMARRRGLLLDALNSLYAARAQRGGVR